MYQLVNLLAAVLATWRLTELVTLDRITHKLREKFPYYLVNCSRCVSVYAGLVATLIYFIRPEINWVFALAWMYLWQADIRNPIPVKGVNVTATEKVQMTIGQLVLANAQLEELVQKLQEQIKELESK